MLAKHVEQELAHCPDPVLSSAKSACQFWKFGVVLKPLCGWVGIVLEAIASYHMYRARETLRKPILVWLLIVVWPVWSGLEFVRGVAMQFVMPRNRPAETAIVLVTVAFLSTMIQMITAFFVRNGIFHEWIGYLDDEDTRRCVRWWERAFLFLQFPAMMVYVWIMTLWFVEGWTFEDFRDFPVTFSASQILDFSLVALPFILGMLGTLVSIIYEYKAVTRFESRLWTPLNELRKQRAAPPPSPAPSVPQAPIEPAF